MEFISTISPVIQSLLASLFTYLITALGAALVFLPNTEKRKNKIHKHVYGSALDSMTGFAAGIMIAASYWSLLKPSIALASELDYEVWLVCGFGFLSGGIILSLINLFFTCIGSSNMDIAGMSRRSFMLFLSVTIHNIPEGLAIGVAFGAAALGMPSTSIATAITLAIGIGLQNFPEGAAVSLPLHHNGLSKQKSFFWGQLSAAVEPISAIVGAVAIIFIRSLLPFALAFAAGAMIFVSVSSLIPSSCGEKGFDLGSICVLLGFCIMMLMDVLL